jgi:acyl-coenzyme A thioesterase PaaI-like protein
MTTLGAELADVAAGRVSIALPIEPRLSQQDGHVHAGFVVAALDSACGYAEQGLGARARGDHAGDDGAAACRVTARLSQSTQRVPPRRPGPSRTRPG